MDKFEEKLKDLDGDFSEEKDKVIEEMEDLSPKKKDKDTIFTSFLETPEYILEQIINAELAELRNFAGKGENTSFIKYSKLTDTWEVIDKFKYQDKTYKPIIDDVFTQGGVCLPSGVKEYKNTKEIIDQIKEYLNKRIQLPTKPINYEKFLPHLILFYWVYEKFPFIPYIHFVGGTSTGKTTAMEVIGNLCYKAVDSTSSLTIASMFRIATLWKGTLLIDEFNKFEGNEIILFLKAGVSNRLLYRVEGERMKELKAYIIKSPKIFTSETPINDAGLQSRTIVIKMDKNTRELPLYMLKEDSDECMDIRNKLLLWRLRNLNQVDLSKIRYGFPELKSFDRRVQQIITPIYYFSSKGTKKDILDFARDQEAETLRSRKESIDGAIFEILLDIWEGDEEAQLKEVCATFNTEQKNRGYKEEYTEKRIGNVIRKIIGFDTERRGHDKNYWVIWDKETEVNKREYYGFPPSPTKFRDTASSANEPEKDIVADAKNIFGT